MLTWARKTITFWELRGESDNTEHTKSGVTVSHLTIGPHPFNLRTYNDKEYVYVGYFIQFQHVAISNGSYHVTKKRLCLDAWFVTSGKSWNFFSRTGPHRRAPPPLRTMWTGLIISVWPQITYNVKTCYMCLSFKNRSWKSFPQTGHITWKYYWLVLSKSVRFIRLYSIDSIKIYKGHLPEKMISLWEACWSNAHQVKL